MNSDTGQRFYLDDSDAAAVRDGYAWLLRHAADNRNPHATIFLRFVSDIPNLEEGLGRTRTTALLKDRKLTDNGTTVGLYTSRSVGRSTGPVLGVWVNDEDLLDTLDTWRVPAIGAIPWGEGITDWKARWRPLNIRTGEQAPHPGTAVSNPVVEEALATVTLLSNLSNGLDTYNRDTAAQALLALRRAEEWFDPDEVRAWAARHGWGASNAAELADLARKVAQGRRVRTGSQRLREDIVERWREEAADAEGNRQ